jgi:hypothetical protein
MKYPKANSIEQTQESMIIFLASQFKPVDIKVAFAALIGKVGSSAQTTVQVKSLAMQSCPNCSVHCQCRSPRGTILCSLFSVELTNY